MKELNGRVAVVTGGASGIGLAMARRFGAAGMKLALADVEKPALDQAAADLGREGFEVLAVPTDVSDADAMDALGEQVLGRFGAVHLLCNNAGVGGGGVMWELTKADWQYTIGVNLWGVIHGVRVFVKHLVEQDEGHVVNTASMAGLVSVPGIGPYNVTKHAVVTLSETLHGELKSAGSRVGVSVLCPGFVNTRIYESHRNRPAELQNVAAGEDTAAQEQRREMAARFFAAAMAASDVAEKVHDAVVGDAFYILTHDGSAAGVQRRMENIVEGRSPDVTAPTIFGQNRD